MKTKSRWRLALFTAAAFACGSTWAAAVEPTTFTGNFTSCSQLDVDGPLIGGSTQTAPVNGQSYAFGSGQSITFNYTPEGQNQFIGFTSTIPMDYIVVKGSAGYNVFHYDPADASDINLFSPNNESGDPAGVSHVTFCVFPKPSGSKTANATWDQYTDWEIDKSVTPESITMFDGDTHEVAYTVTATPTTKGTYRVSGNITVNDPLAAGWSVLAVADTLNFNNNSTDFNKNWDGPGGNADTMTCSDPAGAVILSCSYAFELSSADYAFLTSATGGVNSAGITTKLGGDTYTFAVTANFTIPSNPAASFGSTFSVNDSVLPANPDHTFTLANHSAWTYNNTFACNEDNGSHPNTATGTWTKGPDTNGTDSDTATVNVYCKTVSVSKTASTTYAREYAWTPEKYVVIGAADANVIGKTGCLPDPIASGDYAGSFLCNDAELKLNPGDTYDTVYKLIADQSVGEEDTFVVDGSITVSWPSGVTPHFNPATPSDTLTFTDATNGTQPVDPDCTAQGATSLSCTYSATLPRDFVPGYNQANITRVKKCYDSAGVATDCGTVTYDSNQAALTYGAPSVETNKCVDLSDLFNGIAGQNSILGFEWLVKDDACEDFSAFVTGDVDPTVLEKFLDISANGLLPAQTGEGLSCEFVVPNLLKLSGDNGEDTATISVTVTELCNVEGCTYTLGYWKTHVNYAPKPQFAKKRDAAWDLIDGANALNENALFFSSGKSYVAVMWTPPAGNSYYVLAQQYIAAKLNVLDGASDSAIALQLAQAEALFTAYGPNAQYWKKNQTTVATLAGMLAAFNEGTTGPGHCSISPATLKAAN